MLFYHRVTPVHSKILFSLYHRNYNHCMKYTVWYVKGLLSRCCMPLSQLLVHVYVHVVCPSFLFTHTYTLIHSSSQALTCTCHHPPSSGVMGMSVYTWGSNSNVTLGHDHSRNHPERLDLSGAYSVSQVCVFFLNGELQRNIHCSTLCI